MTIKIEIGGFLALIFTILKLSGIIFWSWFWVLSPIWIPIVIMLFIFAVVIIVNIFLEIL